VPDLYKSISRPENYSALTRIGKKAIGKELVGLKLLWSFGKLLDNVENVKDFGIILSQN
jgi:hypothetical protein